VFEKVDDRLSHWRKKIGECGVDMIEELMFRNLSINGTENRASYCHWALSGDDSCQPFYYATYKEPESDDEEGQPVAKVRMLALIVHLYYFTIHFQGVFQSPLIASIFGVHVAWLSSIEEGKRSPERPIGALVHSIQAVTVYSLQLPLLY